MTAKQGMFDFAKPEAKTVEGFKGTMFVNGHNVGAVDNFMLELPKIYNYTDPVTGKKMFAYEIPKFNPFTYEGVAK